jgi:hypothetical protein
MVGGLPARNKKVSERNKMILWYAVGGVVGALIGGLVGYWKKCTGGV